VHIEVDNAENKLGTSSGLEVQKTYVFPTTFAQRRLWFLDQLQPLSVSYLVPWSMRLTGELDVAALEASLNEIVRRHEVFRTRFSMRDDAPVQVVASSLKIEMPVVDLSIDPARERRAEAIAREEGLNPMDLQRGPLLRSKLLKLAGDDHILLLTTHHIVLTDGRGEFLSVNCPHSTKLFPPDGHPLWPNPSCNMPITRFGSANTLRAAISRSSWTTGENSSGVFQRTLSFPLTARGQRSKHSTEKYTVFPFPPSSRRS
jgi:hypothetical protein